MNIIKRVPLILIVLIAILLTGCSPRESASEVAKKYSDRVNSGDYETAYDLLSKDTKKKVSLERFKEYQDVLIETKKVIGYKLGKEENIEKKKYDRKEYKNLIKLEETYDIKDMFSRKRKALKVDRYFVVENNRYKLLWHENFKSNLSSRYLDFVYLKLENFSEESFKEIDILLKKATDADSSNSDLYYIEASNYMYLDDYDNALLPINNCLKYLDKKSSDYKKKASDAYNLKGVILMCNKKYDEAKKFLNKSLDINQNNADAKYNLDTIKNDLE
ncbi:tetratricopeptide repeat protein [Clostridioides sp. ES-S-0145-01]|uniref:tetratricopeptide repeat protein n=1 Tax=Clostridioides sp. ES-S-0145-01 TaxID=2770784 RepID=UPI001D1103D3|nr:tetratricopeptide repeat protein [Clostridioides sp. ES-S-0145-01]